MKNRILNKAVKLLSTATLVCALALCGNKAAVFAEVSDSASYNLYYNSPSSYTESVICGILYYDGPNYFNVSGISGNSYTIVVSCSGYNVSMPTMSASKTGTQSFQYEKQESSDIAKFRVSMTHTSGMTAYASGRVYHHG